MARACSVCTRPDAGTINQLLASGRSARSVALEVGLSADSVQRHAANHVANPQLRDTRRRVGSASNEAPEPLNELIDALRQQALAGNPALVHQYRLALQAQATMHAASPPTSFVATADWAELRGRVLAALEPFPQARQAVADALGDT